MKPMIQELSPFFCWDKYASRDIPDVMKKLADCGCHQLTINCNWALRMAFDMGFLKRIKKSSDEARITFTGVHAPFAQQWDLLAPSQEFMPIWRYVHYRLMEILPAEFGIGTYTMHLMNDLYPGTVDDAEKQLEQIFDTFLAHAEKCQIILAMENGFQEVDLPTTLVRYFKRFPSPYLGCCLDLAHAHVIATRRGETVEDYLAALLPWIVASHLHDNDGTADRHWPFFQGNLPWERLMPVLVSAPRLQSLQNEANVSSLTIEELCALDNRLMACCKR